MVHHASIEREWLFDRARASRSTRLPQRCAIETDQAAGARRVLSGARAPQSLHPGMPGAS
jgi:hypothetical protein